MEKKSEPKKVHDKKENLEIIPQEILNQKKQLLNNPEEKKQKKWWKGLFNEKRIMKTNKVAVIYLRDVGIANPVELEVKEGMFNFGGKVYHEDRDCIYRLILPDGKTMPLAIIQEWDMTPLGTKEETEKKDMDKLKETFSKYQDLALKAIRYGEISRRGGEGYDLGTKKFTTKELILYVILAIIVGAIFTGYF